MPGITATQDAEAEESQILVTHSCNLVVQSWPDLHIEIVSPQKKRRKRGGRGKRKSMDEIKHTGRTQAHVGRFWEQSSTPQKERHKHKENVHL